MKMRMVTQIVDKPLQHKWLEIVVVPRHGWFDGPFLALLSCLYGRTWQVYAVEYTDMAEHARTMVEKNGFKEVIEVIQDTAESLELPEKVMYSTYGTCNRLTHTLSRVNGSRDHGQIRSRRVAKVCNN